MLLDVLLYKFKSISWRDSLDNLNDFILP